MRDVGQFRKEGLTILPCDAPARTMVGKLKDGERFFAELWRPRNMGFHRKYFAMLNNVVEASSEWPSRARLEMDIAIALKAGDWYEGRHGRTFIPHSRAVASMSRDDFDRLYAETVTLLTQWIGVNPETLQDT
jgi:hypothetical protein